ncbi:FKBP-type peptidyl-prolyl cis-trans isomerase [Undibacterium piscinae]|uniref:Peptidyl-prolyl cis-trans isomerase n=1 Tax=Undibacterium piscinae TaxID=2495591 RepID=A0A6M4A576_9BURK|nr:FKBP-type peptidyl-prolyl cis-trans isomerase [Undibacterium piscinae]
MTTSLNRIASLILTASIAVGISACGGGSTPSAPVVDTSGSASVVALKTIDTTVGSGVAVNTNNKVTVIYTGWLYDVKATNLRGAKFDGGTFTFTIGGNVIAGWNQGIPGMQVGGKRTLIIPSSLGYGPQGNGPIPGNTALVFDVELVSVQ